ncbi:MAG: nucleoside monophosphate kinase [Candidatus Paceibacterota bacterium]
MDPHIFVFFGRSGSGKGTQVELLREYLKKKDPGREIIHVETGKKLRAHAEDGTYSGHLTHEVLSKGGLMPEFLPIYMWSDTFVKEYSGEEHLILDGVSRRLPEAGVLLGAINFYHAKKAYVVHIDVAPEIVKQRLLERKRPDDTEEYIASRLAWFEENTRPAIDFFKNAEGITFIEIDGSGGSEKVHEELIKRIEQ